MFFSGHDNESGVLGPVMVAYSHRRMGSPGRGPANSPMGRGSSPIQTVRTFFPETWIWDLVEVG